MKKIKHLLILIVIILVISLYNIFITNPKQIKVRQETITSQKINKSMNDFKVLFMSDIHYGTSIKQKELKSLVNQINDFDVDLILFGGDLVDHYSLNVLSEKDEKAFIKAFAKLEAKYGKYAVLGNHDLDSKLVKENITRILNESGFEILDNNNIKIYDKKGSFINLVGIDSLLHGQPDVKKAYDGIDTKAYTITICHTPDIFNDLKKNQTDLLLSGHSHGGQIYLPYISQSFLPNGTKDYYRGSTYKNGIHLDVTNGVGTTQKNIRLFADAEIVIYKLKTSAS